MARDIDIDFDIAFLVDSRRPNRTGRARQVYNWPHKDVEVIVVTDGSRVLGLGDLGMHGMAVVIGKVDLYVVGGGFYPTRTLPCILDLGTNNPRLLGNPDEYLGLQSQRVDGERYLELVDEFMHAASLRWPNAVIQFEDFQVEPRSGFGV